MYETLERLGDGCATIVGPPARDCAASGPAPRTLVRVPSPKRVGSVAYSLTMFAIVSVLAGVLVAGLFVPYAGLAGMGSKAAAAELNSLPTELATPTPPTRSTVYMADGKVLAYFYDENRIPVALDKIAPIMRQAQLAIEDHRYYEHGALDVKGTLRALVRNSTSDAGTQGGSSITQQYVKMVQIEACQTKGSSAAATRKCVEDARAPTMERKVRELRYAIALEKRLTKDQILSNYLNIAYYGSGTYGVEAAARHYYNTSAAKLTLPQAAMLAGLVQNPDANNPMNNKAAALERRDVVVNRMSELGLITPAQVKSAKAQGFDTKAVKSIIKGCQGTRYPFLCQYVQKTLELAPSLGDNKTERDNLLNRGGLKIYTAIDPKTQDLAQKKVSAFVGSKDPLISTMNMIQPGTGLIVASAQSRPKMGTKKGQTYWNLSAPTELGGIQGYQAGSTFKAFTIAAALEKGIPISKKFNAKSPMDFSGRKFDTCDGKKPIYGKFKVKNSVGHSKKIRMTEAAEWSVNTYFVQLELADRHVRRHQDGAEDGCRRRSPDRQEAGQHREGVPGQAVLHAGHGRGQPAVDGRGVRDLRLGRHPLQPDHRVQDRQPERQGAQGPRRRLQARHGQGRGRRGQQGPQGRDQEGHRHPGAREGRSRPGGQDRDDRQRRGRVVRGLHAQDRRRRDDLDRQPAQALHQGQVGLPQERRDRLPRPVLQAAARGLRLRRLRPVHLEAGHAGVLQADPAHEVRQPAQADRDRQEGHASPTSAT